MANIRGKQAATNDQGFAFEEVVPYSAWTEDSTSHYLLVDLPGFIREQLKLEVDGCGHVVVSGERRTNDNKIIHFKQTFTVPENADMNKVSGKYEGEVLHAIIPKLVKDEEEKKDPSVAANIVEEDNEDENEKQEEHDKETEHGIKEMQDREERHDGKNTGMEGLLEGWRSESGVLGNAMEMLIRNKGIVVTALLAFSLGVLITQQSQSNPGTEGNT